MSDENNENEEKQSEWKCLSCGESFAQQWENRPFVCENPNCGKTGPFKAITGPFIFFNDNHFVPQFLADTIKDDRHFLTARDNEDTFVYEENVYNFDGNATIKEQCRRKLGKLAKEHYVNETLHHVKQTTYVPRDWIDADNPFIVTKNCVLNPLTLETTPHTPEIFTTISIPVTYDPEKDCPEIKKFLSEVVAHDNIKLLQEVCGNLFTKNYRFQKAVMMLGGGANGKSTLIRVIAAMIGKNNIATPSLQSLLYDRFAASQLYHKLANLHADIPTKELKNTGLFKMLLGEDWINGQRKHRDPFDFLNYAKLIYSANELPKTDDLSPAFFRRWTLINFPNTFPEDSARTNPNILDKLTTDDELSGFLNWSLQGLHRLLKNNHFSKTQSSEEIEAEWIRQTDSLAAFVRECVRVEVGSFVPKELFYEHYTEYCTENESDAITKSSVGHRLPTLISQTSPFKPRYKKGRVTAWKDIFIEEHHGKDSSGMDVIEKVQYLYTSVKVGQNIYYCMEDMEKIDDNTPDIPDQQSRLDRDEDAYDEGYPPP